MSTNGRFYITTPVYYVNDKPHIGHAYTTLACDVLARFKRLDGFEVKFLTGTDEHGRKVEQSARAHGVDAQTFVDRVSSNFRELTALINISEHDFIRTTGQRHEAACRALWETLARKGEIYPGTYKGWYAVRDEAFYTEAELTTGPDGGKLAPSGAPVEWIEEAGYFFRLSAWTDRLLAFYENNPGFIAPESRRNETLQFVRGGLKDLSISRADLKWGVPIPGDDAGVMYVWLDALTSYLSATGYPEDASYKSWWPADLHVVGKDILRFHAVYWPAFLMAAGLPLPRRIFAHGWWTNDGRKISKSVGNVIDPGQLIEKYGLDQTRFFLLREVRFGADGDFSHRSMIARMNSELANDLGNLSQRVLSMIAKDCAGAIPHAGPFTEDDNVLLSAAHDLLATLRDAFDRQALHQGLEAIWGMVRASNAYMDRQAPWTLRTTNSDRMHTVLWVLAETIRHVAILLQPIVPTGAASILDQLAVPCDARYFKALALGGDGALAAGTVLPRPYGVFPRYAEG